MFECPLCGYRDEACWRASHWFLYTITCKIDELESLNPKLGKMVRESGGRLEFGPYIYRGPTKGGRVYRVLKELEGEYKRGHWQEKPKDPFKRQLTDFQK